MLQSVWHTSWTVSNLERSIAFYRDLLGFELFSVSTRVGRFIETVVGFDKAELKIAALRIPGAPVGASNHHLELIEYVAPKGIKLDLKTCNVGAAHLALGTNDIHETHERLAKAGVTFVSPPVRIETGPRPGGYACYLRDPDGFTIELVQPPPPLTDEAARQQPTVPAGRPVSASFDLQGRVALVTGAARGLGAAMAEALAEAGAHVVLNDIDPASLELRCEQLRSQGRSVEGLPFDVADSAAVTSSLRQLAERRGRLDILVNNAGIAVYQGIEDHDLGDWDRVMNVNLTSLFVIGREAAKLMAKGGYGRIINISSVLGLVSRPGIPSYVVSKHGVVGLTRAMASDLGGRGITCNAIAPGYFQTPMNQTLEADQDFHRMIANRTPLKRWADPSELKGPVLFLASPASSFVNGHVLTVDGGITASLF